MIIGPCLVVTGGARPGVVEGGVRVVGAHIAQVGPLDSLAAAYPNEPLWPARDRVLVPGLVNTHAHLARHLARGLGLGDAREWARYEQALSPEDVYWASLAAMVEGVRHGVTTVCDFHRSSACVDLSLSEIVSAARALGVRVAACYGAAEHDSPAERFGALEESRSLAADLVKRREGRLRGMIGVQAETLTGVERLMRESAIAAGGDLAVHVDLTLDATPGERWRSDPAWRQPELPSLWAHAERAPRGLLAAVQDRGDALSATGVGSIAALAREAELSWGSDGGVNAPPLLASAPGWVMPEAEAEMHYRRLFVTGAQWAAPHFGESLGEIRSGAPADLLLVDYRPATEFSARTLHAHMVSGLLRAPVSGAMVAGEVVLDNGSFVTVDEREVAARARECAARVWERMS